MNRRPINGNCFVARGKKKGLFGSDTLKCKPGCLIRPMTLVRANEITREYIGQRYWLNFFFWPKVIYTHRNYIVVRDQWLNLSFRNAAERNTPSWFVALSVNCRRYKSDVAKIDVGFNRERFTRSRNTPSVVRRIFTRMGPHLARDCRSSGVWQIVFVRARAGHGHNDRANLVRAQGER